MYTGCHIAWWKLLKYCQQLFGKKKKKEITTKPFTLDISPYKTMPHRHLKAIYQVKKYKKCWSPYLFRIENTRLQCVNIESKKRNHKFINLSSVYIMLIKMYGVQYFKFPIWWVKKKKAYIQNPKWILVPYVCLMYCMCEMLHALCWVGTVADPVHCNGCAYLSRGPASLTGGWKWWWRWGKRATTRWRDPSWRLTRRYCPWSSPRGSLAERWVGAMYGWPKESWVSEQRRISPQAFRPCWETPCPTYCPDLGVCDATENTDSTCVCVRSLSYGLLPRRLHRVRTVTWDS